MRSGGRRDRHSVNDARFAAGTLDTAIKATARG